MTATAEPEVPSPREDLYRHVNAGWLDTHEIPADQGAYGAFLELRDAAELAVRHLCEDAVREVGTGFDPAQARVQATAAAGAHRDVPLAPLDEEDAEGTEHPELKRRIAALYASFMDDETVEARGLEPIASDLAAVATVSTPAELLALSGRLQRQGVSGLINTGALNDAGNPDRMLLHLLQGGLGLPDESYYRDEAYAEILEQYTEHTGRLLALAGIGADRDEAAALGVRVVELEKRIAALHWDLVRSRDAVARYNPMTHDRLTELFPLADAWLEGVDAAGERAAEVVVWQPEFLSGVQGLLEGPEAADLEDWRHWLILQVLRSFAGFLPDAFVQENFSFYGRRLAGTEEVRPRWKRAVAFVNGAAGEDVAQLYVARHFPQGHVAAMDELVGLLQEAYRRSIEELEWMGEETRQRALEKLAMFRPMVGYPSKWLDYSALEVHAGGPQPGPVRRGDEGVHDAGQRGDHDALGRGRGPAGGPRAGLPHGPRPRGRRADHPRAGPAGPPLRPPERQPRGARPPRRGARRPGGSRAARRPGALGPRGHPDADAPAGPAGRRASDPDAGPRRVRVSRRPDPRARPACPVRRPGPVGGARRSGRRS